MATKVTSSIYFACQFYLGAAFSISPTNSATTKQKEMAKKRGKKSLKRNSNISTSNIGIK